MVDGKEDVMKHVKPDPGEQLEKLFVSLKTLSEMCDTSRSSMRRWLLEAGVRPVSMGCGRNGAIRYRWEDVKAWLDSREHVN